MGKLYENFHIFNFQKRIQSRQFKVGNFFLKIKQIFEILELLFEF